MCATTILIRGSLRGMKWYSIQFNIASIIWDPKIGYFSEQ